ncbi:hypothetical protein PRZ48_010943 [Zasmidium cellare]|uniref:Heterokaryon incompatibility domain-containing protein n=1 Tax=Zasmidium cellare TaxID=395010 RepID=A0ABR0EAX7_ZASCE|nr:hypothetical protein PRZ48_010943 [Zasmidium cellare]
MGKTQDLEEALEALVLKEPEGTIGERVLLDHEVDVFETSYSQLRDEPGLPGIRIRIICRALRNRNYDMVSRLLAKVDENEHCLRGQLCVMKALILNRLQPSKFVHLPDEPDSVPKMLDLLLRHDAPASIADEHGPKLLHAGADPHQLVSLRMTEIGGGEMGESKERFVQNLLQATWRTWAKWTDYPATLDYRDKDLEKGHAAIMLQLVDVGLEMDSADPILVSVYHMLCYHGHLERVKKLTCLGVGAQKLGVDRERGFSVTSALQAAAIGCQSEVVKYLLDTGASRSFKGPVHVSEWASRKVFEPDRPMTALVAAPYYYRSSGDIYNIYQLLFDPNADEDDLRCLLYFSIEERWMGTVKDLLARNVKIERVPLSLDTALVDILIRHGSFLDGRRFLQFALNRANLEVLTYLEQEHGVRLELHDFPHVIVGLMGRYHYRQWARGIKRRGEYAEIMKYLLVTLSLSVDDTFRMAERDNLDPDFEDYDTLKDVSEFANCEITSTDMDAYRPIRLGDDTTDPGVQTSLLRLACEWELFPVVRWLIEDEKADPTCPGLPHCALDYYIRRPRLETRLMGDDLDEQLVLLLLERSRSEDVRYWGNELATNIQQNVEAIKACTTWKDLLPRQLNESRTERIDDVKVSLPRSFSSQGLPFTYRKLCGDNTIRLFHLEAATALSDHICGTLSDHDPFDCPPFEALSYVWGDSTKQRNILLNNRSFGITENLAAALSRVRLPETSRILWVDAICINQQDDHEKGHQVILMGNIYQRAKMVLAWIGEHADGSQSIFEWHESNKDEIEKDAMEQKEFTGSPMFSYTDKAQTAFEAVCRRPYWYRTWILQEVGLGVKATVLCGPDTVDLWKLMRFGKEYRWFSDYHPLRGPNATRHAERVSRLAIHCDISSVGMLTRCCQCKDPRDKVFGILGLLASKPIPVRYDIPVADVYRSFTQAVIEHRNDLFPLHSLGPNRNLPELDSWVPDWSISKPRGVLRRVADTEYLGWELKEVPDVTYSWREVTIKGVRLDTILSVGGTLSVPDDQHKPNPASTLQQWEQLILPEVHQHGIAALSTFARTLHASDKYCINDKPGSAVLFPFVMWYHHHGTGLLRREAPRTFELVELAMVMLQQIEDWNAFELSMQEKIWRYTEQMEVSCYGRQFYLTEKGSMGLAPPGARVGDEIVFFPGGLYPFVVRDNGDGRTWEMVGDCHFEDLDGEVIKGKTMEYFALR